MEKADPIGLVEYLTRSLTKHPDDIKIITVKGHSSLVIELRVNEEDRGAVIGRKGRIVRSMRTLLNSISAKDVVMEDGSSEEYSQVLLEIIDEGE